MATILNASTSSGLVATADNSGVIQLQTNGTNTISVATTGLTTIAYNGANAGIVPGMQLYRLESTLAGANATGAQSIFGVGVTLSSSTVYRFEADILVSKSAGTTSHTLSTLFGGTATLNSIAYLVLSASTGSQSTFNFTDTATTGTAITQASATVVAAATTAAAIARYFRVSGIVSINAGGTFIPQYQLSAAPGGAYSINANSNFSIYPIGASGSNVSIGTWA